MNNIFENAKFGDRYMSRCGKIMIYVETSKSTGQVMFITQPDGCVYAERHTFINGRYDNETKHKWDIVSKLD